MTKQILTFFLVLTSANHLHQGSAFANIGLKGNKPAVKISYANENKQQELHKITPYKFRVEKSDKPGSKVAYRLSKDESLTLFRMMKAHPRGWGEEEVLKLDVCLRVTPSRCGPALELYTDRFNGITECKLEYGEGIKNRPASFVYTGNTPLAACSYLVHSACVHHLDASDVPSVFCKPAN